MWPRSVTGDAAYGTVENVAAVEKAGDYEDVAGELLGEPRGCEEVGS